MAQMSWKDAIRRVLREAGEPLHYQEITERILAGGMRSGDVGATPAATVNALIASAIKHDGESCEFARVGRGLFAIRNSGKTITSSVVPAKDDSQAEDFSDAVIRAFGVYWRREDVVWRRLPRLLGRQQVGATSVDFGDQRGVYILHDHHATVYVGRAMDRPLGQRLFEHTLDRLSSRWSQFSWFGLRGVSESGSLLEIEKRILPQAIIPTLEAILIETLEPPQNRRRGDDFMVAEYIQGEDPELREQEIQRTMREIERKFRG